MSIRKGTVKIGNITKIVNSGGGIIPTGTLNIINNGDYDVSKYASAKVNVTPILQDKTVTPSTSVQTITPNSGYDGLSSVEISAVDSSIDSNIKASNIKSGVKILNVTGTLKEGITPSGTLSITSNGTRDVINYASVNVNVPSEDLSNELNTYETYLSTQETTIDQIISELAGKAAGGGGNNDLLYQILNRTVTEINDSNITKFGDHSIRACSSLTSVNAPNATTISTYAFYYCTYLTTFSAPKVTTLGTYAFYNDSLTSINFPLATSIPHSCFYQNIFMTRADFGVAQSIAAKAFYSCVSLEALILRKTGSICTLANVDALADTPIAKGNGYVYVPDNLVDSYKTATNWSTYAAQIKGLSELEG